MLLLLFLNTAMIASYKGGYGQDAFGVGSTGASALVVGLLLLFAFGFAFRFDWLLTAEC
jgi:hypothetical protein